VPQRRTFRKRHQGARPGGWGGGGGGGGARGRGGFPCRSEGREWREASNGSQAVR